MNFWLQIRFFDKVIWSVKHIVIYELNKDSILRSHKLFEYFLVKVILTLWVFVIESTRYLYFIYFYQTIGLWFLIKNYAKLANLCFWIWHYYFINIFKFAKYIKFKFNYKIKSYLNYWNLSITYYLSSIYLKRCIFQKLQRIFFIMLCISDCYFKTIFGLQFYRIE